MVIEWGGRGFLALDVAGILLQSNPSSQSLIPDLIYLVPKVKLRCDLVTGRMREEEGGGGPKRITACCQCLCVGANLGCTRLLTGQRKSGVMGYGGCPLAQHATHL